MNPFDALSPEDFISQGDVFLMEHEDVDGIHYMVVLNVSPESSEVIVLGVLTTKIENRRHFIRLNCRPPETLVEFSYFKPSAVDCNTLKEIEKIRPPFQNKQGTGKNFKTPRNRNRPENRSRSCSRFRPAASEKPRSESAVTPVRLRRRRNCTGKLMFICATWLLYSQYQYKKQEYIQ